MSASTDQQPPNPPVALTETTEFKDALAKAVAAAAAGIEERTIAAMKTALATAPLQSTSGDVDQLFNRMALAIGEIADQGTNRKKVAPEILAARAAAYDRMGVLLNRVQAEKLQPRYKLVAKVVLAERLIDPWRPGADGKMVQTGITYRGCPNEAMRPINDIAKEIYREFLGWIGGSTAVNGTVQKPTWLTKNGVVIEGHGPATVTAHGGSHDPEPIDADLFPMDAAFGGNGAVEIDEETAALMRLNDPTSPEIHVLGTIAAPAKRNIGPNGKAML